MVQPPFTTDDEAIRREAGRIRRRAELDEIAQQIGGPGTRVRDPETFTRFLDTAAAGYAFVNANPNANIPEPPPDMWPRILPREQRANYEHWKAARAGAPRGTLERAELIALPLLAWSPGSLAGAIGGTVAQEAATRAGAPVPVQIGAGVLGGVAAGSPETVAGATRLVGRGAGAAVRGGQQLAEQVGQTNIGNVLLPPSPQPVARPLIYERLTPTERKLFGLPEKGRVSRDELEGARTYIYGRVDPETGVPEGGLLSAEDAASVERLEREISELQQSRVARKADWDPDIEELYDGGLLRAYELQEGKGRADPMTFRWHGRGLDEIAQEYLPEHLAQDSHAPEILIDRLRQFRAGGQGLHPREITARRQEIDAILAKYLDEPDVAAPVMPQGQGPVAQAGLGGEFGPAQVARKDPEAAENFMRQAPLSEAATEQANRVAAARQPVPQPPPSSPPARPVEAATTVPPAATQPPKPPPATAMTAPAQGHLMSFDEALKWMAEQPPDIPRQQQPPNLLTGLRDPNPPPPPKGPVGGVPEPPPPQGIISGFERPPIAGNIIGLREITPGLTKSEEVENVLLGVGRAARLPFHLNNKYGTAAVREKQRVAQAINSQATQFSHRQATAIRQAFPDLEDDLFVPSLAGKVQRIPGAPAIQDIADFYPQFEPLLTPAQKAALKPIIDTHAQYTDLLNKVGVGFPSRASTRIGGGSYIARVAEGLAATANEPRGVPGRGLFAKARKGFEEDIQFETAAAGRVAGVKYAGIEDALRYHYRQAGERATEAHIANYLTTVTDDTNWPISLARRGDLDRKAVDLAALADHSFPEAVADSINKVLVNQGATIGGGRNAIEALRMLNRGYRGLRATLDNSFMGIQMLLSAYSHPVAAARASRVNFESWANPKVLARFLETFDAKAPQTGRLTASQWASEGGVHLGAQTGEFAAEALQKAPLFKQAGRAYGYTGDALRLDVADVLLEQEMRGYSLFGSPVAIGKGRTLDEIRASGDLAKIGEIVNNMSGVARRRFGGDVGDFLLFAPRFFQSRLETVAKGLIGLRPGASLDQKIARRSLLKMMILGTTLTVAANAAAGEDTDFRPIVNGRKNPNFLRVRALGRDWSLFGTWDSLMGLLIAAGRGDVEGAIRAQSSGLVSLTWDLMSGADYLGRSTRSAENVGRYLLRQLTPFSGEQVAEAGETVLSGKPQDILSGGTAAAATLAGVKSAPLSFTDHANEVASARYGMRWDELKSRRDAALKEAVDRGRTTSPEYEWYDNIMDRVANEVEREYPEDAVPSRLTLSAKREEMARRRYDRNYGDLYANQQAKINQLIKRPELTERQWTPPGRIR
jgi:hypothetical protein